MTIGEKIRQFRREKGLTQEALAAIIHVSRSAIAKWEAGGGLPELENLLQLSAVFGVSIDELVENAANSDHCKKRKPAGLNRMTSEISFMILSLRAGTTARTASKFSPRIQIFCTIISIRQKHPAHME